MSNAFECVANGRADAPPWMVCSIGVSTSRYPCGRVGRAQARDGGRARTHRGARRLARDQVEVALAHARLVAQLGALVEVRQRQQRLGRDLPGAGEHAELAALRRDDLALDLDDVAEVDQLLPAFERLLADLGQRDHDLDAAAVPGLQRREAELAGVAREHDASGDRHGHAGGVVGLEVAPLLAHLRDGVRDLHGDRVRVTLGEQAIALRHAHGLLLGDVVSVVSSSNPVRQSWLSSGRWSRCRSVASRRPSPRSAPAPGPGSRHRRGGRSAGSTTFR